MEDSFKDLNKSFCNENDSQSIKYYEIGMINMKKTSNLNTFNNSSDPQFSGLLPISTNKKLIDFSKSSEELSIFNSITKFKENPLFFRRLTRTKEEISEEDNKKYFERVYNYFYNQRRGNYDTTIMGETSFPIRFNDNSQISSIYPKMNYCQNLPENFDPNEESFESESVISNLNLEKLFSQNPIDLKYRVKESLILEKNKRKFLSKNKINFNILVVGESGIGKTSFIKCFLNIAEKYDDLGRRNNRKSSNISMEDYMNNNENDFYEMKSLNNYNNNFTFIDSPGYGNSLDSQKWIKEIINYITIQYSIYQINKEYDKNVKDCRIHLILYFLSGPKPKIIDFYYMKMLSKYANIIPVISKGDMLTKEEILCCKEFILINARNYNLEFFNMYSAITILNNDNETRSYFFNGKLGCCPPFLIVSSNKKNEQNNFIREYTWGVLNIENNDHSDFMRLYYAILSYIPFECIEKTKKLYKDYKKFNLKNDKVKEVKKETSICKYLISRKYIFLLGATFLGTFVATLKNNKNSK